MSETDDDAHQTALEYLIDTKNEFCIRLLKFWNTILERSSDADLRALLKDRVEFIRKMMWITCAVLCDDELEQLAQRTTTESHKLENLQLWRTSFFDHWSMSFFDWTPPNRDVPLPRDAKKILSDCMIKLTYTQIMLPLWSEAQIFFVTLKKIVKCFRQDSLVC